MPIYRLLRLVSTLEQQAGYLDLERDNDVVYVRVAESNDPQALLEPATFELSDGDARLLRDALSELLGD